MRRMRTWSVRHARGLKRVYLGIEAALFRARPLIERIGYERLDRPLLGFEKLTKGFLLDSRSCGQCLAGATGMSCPMNCPKELRNGPCGGVRTNGKCEVDPEMDCVWVLAWEGNKRLRESEYPIQRVQPPLDHRRWGRSAWLREVRLRQRDAGTDSS